MFFRDIQAKIGMIGNYGSKEQKQLPQSACAPRRAHEHEGSFFTMWLEGRCLSTYLYVLCEIITMQGRLYNK